MTTGSDPLLGNPNELVVVHRSVHPSSISAGLLGNPFVDFGLHQIESDLAHDPIESLMESDAIRGSQPSKSIVKFTVRLSQLKDSGLGATKLDARLVIAVLVLFLSH
jgi:hypothetical protein